MQGIVLESYNYLRSNTINDFRNFHRASTGRLLGFSIAYEKKQTS